MTVPTTELFSLAGKTALVTGASSGLGAHFGRVLAAAGAKVAVAARRRERLDDLVKEINSAGGEAVAVAMDVTDAGSVSGALRETESQLGPLDILVNNAGVAASRHCLKVEEEDWDYIMEANLKGAWRVAQGVAKRSVALGRPLSIINIASILGLRVGFGESVYAVSKAGVAHLTRAMALELARKQIRVNGICPGYFATEMNSDYLLSEAGQAYLTNTPAGRMGELNELNGALLLLAGEAGSFMNGVLLPVDGGHLVSSL